MPVNSPEKVASAIKELMHKGSLEKKVVDKTNIFIRNISWEKQAEQTEELFEAVIRIQKEKLRL